MVVVSHKTSTVKSSLEPSLHLKKLCLKLGNYHMSFSCIVSEGLTQISNTYSLPQTNFMLPLVSFSKNNDSHPYTCIFLSLLGSLKENFKN